ncbi:hypothetical protein HETIRDRAFT_317815 [Heterobasidion irregulare TC 32-1]|uniref:Uncharacterized protein n=1 Tax=Heterobasidion irregulare (strain TC 32-1) TaxID=747525 RepID=W4K934_HETIT|nr:uncharacterized protein HETIRDRAFT_317815 [Heterobasidion irregulare TC 32-1]ETW82337.1 hypothetical protein HETIRDRAFT_317815 [Heterobasidion irregulare TC 32-1]
MSSFFAPAPPPTPPSKNSLQDRPPRGGSLSYRAHHPRPPGSPPPTPRARSTPTPRSPHSCPPHPSTPPSSYKRSMTISKGNSVFCLACETRNEKLTAASLDCISKLISYSFFVEARPPEHASSRPRPCPRVRAQPLYLERLPEQPPPALARGPRRAYHHHLPHRVHRRLG